MLKTVVENQDLGVDLFDRRLSKGHSIFALEVRDIRQVLLQDQCLIIPAPIAAVTPAQDRDAQSTLAVEPSHVFDTRRFSGTAQSEVANTHHRYVYACAAFQSLIIK